MHSFCEGQVAGLQSDTQSHGMPSPLGSSLFEFSFSLQKSAIFQEEKRKHLVIFIAIALFRKDQMGALK